MSRYWAPFFSPEPRRFSPDRLRYEAKSTRATPVEQETEMSRTVDEGDLASSILANFKHSQGSNPSISLSTHGRPARILMHNFDLGRKSVKGSVECISKRASRQCVTRHRGVYPNICLGDLKICTPAGMPSFLAPQSYLLSLLLLAHSNAQKL